MTQSRAEIQKRYRERKKMLDGEAYLQKERQRKNKDYIPVALLSNNARDLRRQKIRKRVRKHRAERKLVINAAENANPGADPNISDTSGFESQSTSETQLIVRMPNFRRNGPRRRTAKAHRSLRILKEQNRNLKRRLKSAQKKAQRHSFTTPSTPRSRTTAMLKNSGIRESHVAKIRKQLLMGNILMSQLRSNASDKDKRARSRVYSSVAGKLLIRYRCMHHLCKEASLNRNRLRNVIKRGVNFASKQRDSAQGKFRTRVVKFMEREDSCITLPGKRDCKKVGPTKIQKRILTDYLGNLHQKFIAENVKCEMSLATFCRLRPKHILPANFLKRNSCLCSKHQNIALKLKMLKSYGIKVSVNPDQYIKDCNVICQEQLPDIVRFSVWKRVLFDGRKKIKIVEEEMQRCEFMKIWSEEISAFKDHVFRVKSQYKQLRELKENLPNNELVIQMDFSENYSCKTADEIQSAYWAQTQVTLHPIVMYYKDPDSGELIHKSFVCVSDESSHHTPTILTILDKLFQLDVIDLTEIQYVHYWTDSPTSQYRNKYIFHAVQNHEELFGCRATWNYFESGHGKGPCDGVGGTTKRLADAAIKAGGIGIQDAQDFFEWAKSTESSIYYFFVGREECARKCDELESWKCHPISGTMKLHAFTLDDKNRPISRETSCYCKVCITDNKCDTWSSVLRPVPDMQKQNSGIPSDYSVGEFVAAVYDGMWYVGRIIELDDGEVEITFMERRKNLYRWTQPPDMLWMSHRDILMKLNPPIPSGKSARMFRVMEADAIEAAFENRN